jgi:large subunit ribosomal protein L6
MSRIGNKAIELPQSVQIEITEGTVSVSGSQGKLTVPIPQGVRVEKKENSLEVTRENETKKVKSLHGLIRNSVYNAVVGVEKQWTKALEVVGTGYNVKQQGEDVVFKVGYSHPVTFKKQEGVSYKVEGNNKVVVSGIDKQLVGQVAHQMKLVRKPDAYKAKGVRYEGEVIKTKPGKKAKA